MVYEEWAFVTANYINHVLSYIIMLEGSYNQIGIVQEGSIQQLSEAGKSLNPISYHSNFIARRIFMVCQCKI